jgi:hypothetical protein
LRSGARQRQGAAEDAAAARRCDAEGLPVGGKVEVDRQDGREDDSLDQDSACGGKEADGAGHH